VIARKRLRDLADRQGLPGKVVEALAIALTEIARNIVVHAWSGEVRLSIVHEQKRIGCMVVARDHGPGIADVSLAMQDGYSSARSLGFGLAGAQRLVDEFLLESTIGQGTTVIMKKWIDLPAHVGG
jgi:serine/threonine-protein kinase RsbT